MKNRFLHCALLSTALLLSSAAQASLITISDSALLSDASTIDFDGNAAGNIAGTASVFSNIGFSQVTTVGTPTFMGDFIFDVNGLGLTSLNGSLAIGAQFSEIDSMLTGSGFAFGVDGTATQFGFEVFDEANVTLRVETYLQGVLQQSANIFTGVSSPFAGFLFQSANAFDEFRVVSTADSGGWGLDNITLAGVERTVNDIPEPVTALLIGFGIAGLGLTRKRTTGQ